MLRNDSHYWKAVKAALVPEYARGWPYWLGWGRAGA